MIYLFDITMTLAVSARLLAECRETVKVGTGIRARTAQKEWSVGLLSVRLGTNDATKARKFYDAVFRALDFGEIGVPMEGAAALFRLPDGPYFMLAQPLDGTAACVGNGDVLGLWAEDRAAVDRWYAAGLANGGTCDGPPDRREAAGGRYCAFLRDPDGHRICAHART